MRTRGSGRWRSLFLALGLFACADQAESPDQDSEREEALADADVPSALPGEDASRADKDAGRSPDGGPNRPANTPDSGGDAPNDAATRTPAREGGAASTTDAASADGGSGQAVDGGSPPPVGDPPAPVTAPMIWGFGIGITDVPAALKFYTQVMKMTAEKSDVKREDRTETILYATEAKRGARLCLMKFDDTRNTRKITAKLVFQAANTRAVNSAAAMHPDYVSRLNIGIVQFDGPETYVHEVGSIFDSGSNVNVPYPIAMGFVVSDLAASRRFYTALGMDESRTGSFGVTDATGSGNITEYTVKFSTGSGLVLQQWSPMRNAKDNPIKVVLFVPDAKAMADKVMMAGGAVLKQAERSAAYDNRLLITAKDPDGYLLDLVQ